MTFADALDLSATTLHVRHSHIQPGVSALVNKF